MVMNALVLKSRFQLREKKKEVRENSRFFSSISTRRNTIQVRLFNSCLQALYYQVRYPTHPMSNPLYLKPT